MRPAPSPITDTGLTILRPVVAGTACAVLRHGEREIRILCDDSAGALLDYGRSDIRCYAGLVDITAQVFDAEEYHVVPASLDNLMRACAWLRGEA